MRGLAVAALVGTLALLGCKRASEESSAPGVAATSEPPAPKAEAEPPVEAPLEPTGDRPYAAARKTQGDDQQAHYQFEGDSFTRDLELHVTVSEQGSKLALQHPGSAALVGEGPVLCSHEFYQGDALGAAVLDHGPIADGRRLLEVWVSCRLGEDIVSVESAAWLVLDDGKLLSRVWSGVARSHGSHVCATNEQIDFVLEGDEVVLTRTEVGEIFEPGVTEYDCEAAREYVEVKGSERIPLSP